MSDSHTDGSGEPLECGQPLPGKPIGGDDREPWACEIFVEWLCEVLFGD